MGGSNGQLADETASKPMDFVGHPVKPISVECFDGSKLIFMPQSDITALETALLTQLFTRLLISAWKSPGPLDSAGYIRDHLLGRHFVAVPPDPLANEAAS